MKPFCPSNALGEIVDAAYTRHPIRRMFARHFRLIDILGVLGVLALHYYLFSLGALSKNAYYVVAPISITIWSIMLALFVRALLAVNADDEVLHAIAVNAGITANTRASIAQTLSVKKAVDLYVLRKRAWRMQEELESIAVEPGKAALLEVLNAHNG